MADIPATVRGELAGELLERRGGALCAAEDDGSLDRCDGEGRQRAGTRARFVDALVDDGFIVLGGPLGDEVRVAARDRR